MLQILKKILDFFLDTKWDTEQYQILSQIPKSFADTKSSISDTKMATLLLRNALKLVKPMSIAINQITAISGMIWKS